MTEVGARERYQYLRDPAEIYRCSFARIRNEADLAELPEDMAEIAVRLIHACGMTDLIDGLAYTPDVARAALGALESGCPVIVDSRMTGEGVIRSMLPSSNAVLCRIDDPRTTARAEAESTTRSAAAIDLLVDELGGAVVAIGNAPTALFRLLEAMAEGAPRPAAILGFPVGFVGAAESKEALIAADNGVPYLTVRGRRGGSAIAAAAVNAIAGLRS